MHVIITCIDDGCATVPRTNKEARRSDMNLENNQSYHTVHRDSRYDRHPNTTRSSPSHRSRDYATKERDWDSAPVMRTINSRDSMTESGPSPQQHSGSLGISIYDMENGLINHRDMLSADTTDNAAILGEDRSYMLGAQDGGSSQYDYHHRRKGEHSANRLMY